MVLKTKNLPVHSTLSTYSLLSSSFKALKDQPAHEPPKRVTDEQKVEVANELHEWLTAGK